MYDNLLRFSLLIVFFNVTHSPVFATIPLNPYVVLTPATTGKNINSFCKYRIESKDYNLASLFTSDSGYHSGSLPLNLGYFNHSVLVCFSIIDSSVQNGISYLSLSHPHLDTVELYEKKDDGKIIFITRTGRNCTPQWPGIVNRHPTIILTNSDGNKLKNYIVRVKTNDVCAISLSIYNAKYYDRFQTVGNILYGIYFGAICIIAFFNLVLFFSVRFSSCIWYFFWILSFGLFQASAYGHWIIIPGMPLWVANYSLSIFTGFCLIFGAIFSIQFLEIGKFNPTLKKLLVCFEILGGLLILISPLDHGRIGVVASSVLSGILVVVCLFAGLISIKSRGRPAVIYSFGLTVLFFGILIHVTKNFGLLPNVFFVEHSILIASAFEAAILSFALFDRISAIEKEKVLERERSQHSERRAVESRLSTLQAQINPHFLFNTLNTIAEMTVSDSRKAEKTVANLSKLFRYTLSVSTRKNVTLAEELEMVKIYLAIEKERFGKRLDYFFDTQGDPSTVVIMGLLLQPLVENAIKHGIAPLPAGGRVVISSRIDNQEVHIKVSDSGNGFGNSPVSDGSKHGLENITERLYLAYGNVAKVSCYNDNGCVVEVTFPKGAPK